MARAAACRVSLLPTPAPSSSSSTCPPGHWPSWPPSREHDGSRAQRGGWRCGGDGRRTSGRGDLTPVPGPGQAAGGTGPALQSDCRVRARSGRHTGGFGTVGRYRARCHHRHRAAHLRPGGPRSLAGRASPTKPAPESPRIWRAGLTTSGSGYMPVMRWPRSATARGRRHISVPHLKWPSKPTILRAGPTWWNGSGASAAPRSRTSGACPWSSVTRAGPGAAGRNARASGSPDQAPPQRRPCEDPAARPLRCE